MRILFTVLMCISISALSQEPQLTVQTGHASTILDVEFNPEGEFIATAGSDHKLVVWHFSTSKQYNTMLGHTARINALAFHPNKKLLVSASDDSTLRVWDYLEGVEIEQVKLDYPINDFKFNKSGSEIYVAGKELISLVFNSLETRKIDVAPQHAFTCVELSVNDSLLFVGGIEERFAFLIDLKSNELIKRFPHSIKSAKFHSEKSEIVYSNNSGVVVAYNFLEQKRKAGTTDWMLNLINDIELDNNLLYFADNQGNVRVIEDEKWFQEAVFKGTNDKITALDLSKNKKYLATTGASKSVVIWDTESRRVVKVLKGLVSQINDLKFSKDGLNIIVGYEDGSMRKTDLISNQTIVNKMSLKSDLLKNVGNFSVVDILKFSDNSADLMVIYKQLHLSIEGSFEKVSEFKVHWNFANNLLTFEKQKNLSKKSEKYIDDLKNKIYHENTYFLSDLPKVAVSDSLKMKATIKGQDVYLTSTENGETIRKIESQHSGLLTAVAFNDKFGFLATAGWDGMIRFWDAKTGDLMVVFGAFGDGQFVYITEEGNYFSSKNALAYIGFSMNGRIFSFEQFDLKYNRPDLVIKNLSYFDEYYEQAFQKAYKKRLDKLGVSADDIKLSLDLPTLTLTKALDEQITDNKLKISLKCEDEMVDLQRLHIYVNGVPEFGKEGKKLKGKLFTGDIDLRLNEGANIIQCYVTNENNTSSLKQTFKVQGTSSKEKDNLYLLTIGVSKYAEKNYNLSYAAKDANDISHLFTDLGNYNLKKSTVLVDSMATKENILQLTDFMKDAKVNDVVVLFVAGHGVLDDELDYYFAPHDMEFSDPSKKGVPFSVFDDMLEMTKSRKKIMFLDACHSGEIDKDEVVKTFVTDDEENQEDLIFRRVGNTVKNIDEVNSFELSKALFADMRVNNGATVISSSGGAEYAIEGDQWNNGVFTYVLLEALSTKKADKNNDKNLSISELQNYVQIGVHEKTGGLQTPTSRVENLNYDFVIVKR